MIPIRQTIRLSTGHVTLCAWGVGTADGLLTDLLTLTATLGALRAEAETVTYDARDVEPAVLAAFWRLAQASLPPGMALAGPLTWNDVLTVLDALFDLNDVVEGESKLQGLTARAAATLERRRQAQTMTSMSS